MGLIREVDLNMDFKFNFCMLWMFFNKNVIFFFGIFFKVLIKKCESFFKVVILK